MQNMYLSFGENHRCSFAMNFYFVLKYELQLRLIAFIEIGFESLPNFRIFNAELVLHSLSSSVMNIFPY